MPFFSRLLASVLGVAPTALFITFYVPGNSDARGKEALSTLKMQFPRPCRISRMATATRSAADHGHKPDLSRWRPPEAAPFAEANTGPGFLWMLSKTLSVLAVSPPNQAEYSLLLRPFFYRSCSCWAAPHHLSGDLEIGRAARRYYRRNPASVVP